MEKLFRILENGGHAAVVQADSEMVNKIEASAHKKFENCLRLTMDDDIQSFLHGSIRIMVERAQWSNRFDGLVILEVGSITDERLLAALELCRKLTTEKILICTQRVREAIGAVLKVGLVPGIWTFREIRMSRIRQIRDAAERQNVKFDRMSTLQETAKLADEVASSPLFNMDVFLSAVAVKKKITAESLKAQEQEGGYVALCREFMNDKVIGQERKAVRRIGFVSDSLENKNKAGKEKIEHVA